MIDSEIPLGAKVVGNDRCFNHYIDDSSSVSISLNFSFELICNRI